ncbi:MAG: HNH endonuclease [Phycisphaerales bacterium]|jgi:5-methylcytosine-specific restriction endonuclease McrA
MRPSRPNPRPNGDAPQASRGGGSRPRTTKSHGRHQHAHTHSTEIRAIRACSLDVPVLLLNKHYAALRIVTARRAFTLLCKELAEVVHVEGEDTTATFSNYDFAQWVEVSALQHEMEPAAHDWVRTVRLSIAVPRVIRLLGYDRLPRVQVRLSRRTIFERDGHQCQYCKRYFRGGDLSVDHVLPRARGGGDSWENLVAACIRCNAAKGDRTPSEAGMPLARAPKRPTPDSILHGWGSGGPGNKARGARSDPRFAAWRMFLPAGR